MIRLETDSELVVMKINGNSWKLQFEEATHAKNKRWRFTNDSRLELEPKSE